MKRYYLFALLLLGMAGVCAGGDASGDSGPYKNTEVLWEATFDSSGELMEDWSKNDAVQFLPHGGSSGTGALLFPVQSPDGACLISTPLDVDKLKGLIQVEAVVRGRNLTRGTKAYFGSKVMLVVTTPNGKRYPEPARKYGTYDWTMLHRVLRIPEGATDVTLVLGIEQAGGEFEVDSVRIYRCVENEEYIPVPPSSNPEAAAIPRGLGTGANYRGFMTGHDLSEAAFKQLAEWNVNLLRFQFTPGMTKADISTPELYLAWIEGEIKRLDDVLPLCEKYGIRVVIDLHAGPGTERNAVASNILAQSTNLDTLDEAWRKISSHYKGNPLIYGYDLLNEPTAENYITGEENPWLKISERLVKVIRAIDPDTPIITEPDFGNTRPIHGDHIIYSPHIYNPFVYSHQGVKNLAEVKWTYPGMINDVFWDKEQLRLSMKDVIDFQRENNVPIYVGEFSVTCWAKGGDQYLKDMIELFEEYGWDWTYHAFREWGGWSLEHEGSEFGECKPSPDNARKRVVVEALSRNRK